MQRRLRVARLVPAPRPWCPALRITHPNTCTDDDDNDDDVHDDRMTSALACAEGTARVASALGADAGRKEEGRSRACAWERRTARLKSLARGSVGAHTVRHSWRRPPLMETPYIALPEAEPSATSLFAFRRSRRALPYLLSLASLALVVVAIAFFALSWPSSSSSSSTALLHRPGPRMAGNDSATPLLCYEFAATVTKHVTLAGHRKHTTSSSKNVVRVSRSRTCLSKGGSAGLRTPK